MSATGRAFRARGLWRTTRHTDKRAAHCTAADRRPTNQVSAWQAGRGNRPTRRRSDILAHVASSEGYRTCLACRRGCQESAITRKLLPWNFSLTRRTRRKLGLHPCSICCVFVVYGKLFHRSATNRTDGVTLRSCIVRMLAPCKFGNKLKTV